MTTAPPPSPTIDAALTGDEQVALRALAGEMIPASTQFGVPGADDESIFREILVAAAGEGARVREALAWLAETAGVAYAQLDASRRVAAADVFGREAPLQASLLFSVFARCYYRDERVMGALGMEARPPFPGGFDVDASDLSLLDPVRARSKIYRDAS